MKSTKPGWWKRGYKIASTLLAVLGVGYLGLLMFPQGLFAYSVERGKFRVYSREPVGVEELAGVLDKAEEKLKGSGIYDAEVRGDVYLTGGHVMYAFLSHKACNSFANSVPFIDNIIINKTDLGQDRVIMNRASASGSNTRSLSGVIAHETVHLFIRKRYGTIAAALMPA